MSPAELESMMPALQRIARKAGDAILDVYSGEFSVTQKEDDSPLTRADLASHVIIQQELQSLTPDIPVLSEESAAIDFRTRSSWETYWLVDPLDGTKEFVNRNGEFTVNIALIDNHVPVCGVVHVPVSGVTYTGIKEIGAFRHEPGEPSRPIIVRLPCADPMVIVGSRSHANPMLDQFLRPLQPYEMVSMGSSLKFCLLAEGKADFYPRLGPTSEWDTGAAHAVVTAAGGQIIELDGKSLEYNRKDSLLNPEFLVVADPEKDWISLFQTYRS